MVHHRCTGCKQEVERRHKFAGGVFCEPCIRASMSTVSQCSAIHIGFWERLWARVSDFIAAPFRLQLKRIKKAKTMQVGFSTMKAKALRIPINPSAMVPQKR